MWRQHVSLYIFSGMVAPLYSGLNMVDVTEKLVQMESAFVFPLTLVGRYWWHEDHLCCGPITYLPHL